MSCICHEGEGSVELTVKVLHTTGNHNIIDQYIRFCKITDEQRTKYGYTQKAIDETMRLCLEQDILAPFLQSRQKEVTDIMVTLFSQEKVSEIHDYNLVKNTRLEAMLEIAQNLIKMGLSSEQISKATGLTFSEIENLR